MNSKFSSTTQPASVGPYGPGTAEPFIKTEPLQDILAYLRDYAREKPDVAALWCFGVGFIVGWKLKPW